MRGEASSSEPIHRENRQDRIDSAKRKITDTMILVAQDAKNLGTEGNQEPLRELRLPSSLIQASEMRDELWNVFKATSTHVNAVVEALREFKQVAGRHVNEADLWSGLEKKTNSDELKRVYGRCSRYEAQLNIIEESIKFYQNKERGIIEYFKDEATSSAMIGQSRSWVMRARPAPIIVPAHIARPQSHPFPAVTCFEVPVYKRCPEENTCCFCTDSHYSYECHAVVDREERLKILKKKNYCNKCLVYHGKNGTCTAKESFRCVKCGSGRHHSAICSKNPIFKNVLNFIAADPTKDGRPSLKEDQDLLLAYWKQFNPRMYDQKLADLMKKLDTGTDEAMDVMESA